MPFHLFSNPNEGDFVTLAEDLSCRLFRRMLDRVNELARKFDVPEVHIPAERITPQHLGARGWSPELGAVRLGLQAGVNKEDWSWLSGQLMLAAFLNELLPSVELEISGRHPVAVAGHFLPGRQLTFQGQQDQLVIRDGSGETLLHLKKVTAEGLAPVWARNDEDVFRVGSASMAVLANADWMTYWNTESPKDPLTPNLAAQKRHIEDTLAFIEERMPTQYLWVSLLMREIVPLIEAGPNRTRSQSFTMWPGQVQLSESSLIQTINLFMHECSHQYFNMLLWFGRVVTKDAPDAYSVLKNTKRPMERILLGYHAFGNILLVLPLLRQWADRISPKDVDGQQQHLGRIVAELDSVLQEHWEQYLEQTGKELYLPLRKRLLAADLLQNP